ncbi:DUF4834 family protein [Tenacibaculum jejuense]|uniref:DUF4834 domain-containing protein n=1 Tax=Tenacibaculum jejuense TaxID=584609 RepID=A0A238U7P2_9FLAO|nr:DUF4834 family protein [Tenacibaculum jejuense]SNR15209.1 conserved protein of unknown function [Tenacibaculum jejuense]
MGLIKTLLIIGIIYYSFKFLARLFAPYLMKKAMSKMEEKMRNQTRQNTTNDIKVGETIIDKKPNSNKQSDKSVGEYIDFEEID